MTDRVRRHLFLIGPMGAGKSTIGQLLAKRLGRPFLDMDAMIVERTGRSIPEIFARDGECAFRALEGETLAELCDREEPAVIATGGGVVLAAPNRRRIREAGVAVWLDAPPEVVAERIAGDANRPLIAGVDARTRARELDMQRRALYEATADFTLRTDACGPDEAATRIAAWLEAQGDAL
jgi:shikimate kinase